MLIDVLPFGVPGIGLLLAPPAPEAITEEPCEKAAFLLLSDKEVEAFVHDALIASASQCLGFLRHALIVVPPFYVVLQSMDANGS